MTIRQRIKRRVRIGYGLLLLGIASFFVAGFLIGDETRDDGGGFWFGFVPFVAAIIYMNFAVRCPRCNGNLGATPAVAPFSFSKKHRFNYCLYCGVSVEEPVEAKKR